MSDDPQPKLRVIEEMTKEPAELVRLGTRSVTVEPVELLPGLKTSEPAERLETGTRELFDGRSLEPGVDAILDQPEVTGSIEHPWGIEDARLAGVPYGWFVLIALALFGGAVWSVFSMRQGEIKLEIDHGVVREKVARQEEDLNKATMLVEQVERTVAAYLKADTLEELLPLVRHPERVRPLIEEDWKVEPKRPLKFVRLTSFEPAKLATKPYWLIRAEVLDGEQQSLLLEQEGETGVKVDWETHVCRQPMPWDRYVAELPAEEALDFRVWAVPDVLYSHEFSNAGRWRCYRLTAKGSEEHLFGYVLADSKAATEMDSLTRISPDGKSTVILRLRRPEGSASPRGVVIEELVSTRWILVDEALQDSP